MTSFPYKGNFIVNVLHHSGFLTVRLQQIITISTLIPYLRRRADGALTESADGPLIMANRMFGLPGGASPKLFNWKS